MKRFVCLFLLVFLTAPAFPQNAEIVPNENLVVEGIPKIPASLAETVERYTNFRGASLGSWDPVKREMLISTRFADTAQIHLVKMPGGARTQLTFYPDSVSSAQFSPVSGNSFVFSKDIGGNEFFQVYRFDNASGQFSKDGKGIYVTTDKDSEFQRLAYVDPASKQHNYLSSHISWDVDEFDLSYDGRTIAFVTNEDGFGVLHLLDTKTAKEKPVPDLPKGIASGVRWHKNNRDLGFNITSARSTSDVYSLDVQTGKVDRWTYSETGGLNTANFSEPQLIHWKSWDGREISGFLYRPPAKFTGKRPVIVNIHGGPEGQFRPGFLGRNNYYLNELGLAMIFPNVRGSTGYGKTFLTMDNGLLREGSYKDINFLLDWIQTQSDLDANRVLITGGSYGGFMTLAVATNYNNRICCSVDVVGPSNLVTFLEHTSGYRQDLRRVEYGDERDPKMRYFLERIAPFNNKKNITKPIFVIAGKHNPRVPASESEQMVSNVRQNGTPVWWLEAKDEGHGFRKKKNQDYQFYATGMFVKEYLLK